MLRPKKGLARPGQRAPHAPHATAAIRKTPRPGMIPNLQKAHHPMAMQVNRKRNPPIADRANRARRANPATTIPAPRATLAHRRVAADAHANLLGRKQPHRR